MNKADIDEVETNVLMQHSWKLGGTMGNCWSPILKVLKQLCSMYPGLEELKNSEGIDDMKKPELKLPVAMAQQINQNED